MNIKNKTKNIVLTALFSAIICITIAFLFHIPTGFNGGYIHLGDIFIYLAAVILPIPYAIVAAGLGAALADALSGAIIWVIPTIIIKSIIVLFFTSKSEKLLCIRNILAVFIAGVTSCLGYYLAGAIISGNFIAPFVTLYLDLIQSGVSGIIFLVIIYTFDKIKIKERI